ncbi:MAG: alkene reductase [Gammaproteobacteria bacterium]
MTTTASLFSPLKIGALTIPNRIVMAPLTRNRANQDNAPHELHVEYYSQRASAGLIITEASQVSEQGVGYPSTPGIYHPVQVSAWRSVTDAVHAKGGRIFLQLWHVGRISHPSLQVNNALPVAPSAIKPAGDAITYDGPQAYVEPRALEITEINEIVQQFQVAAHNAKVAGFDGVEIHAANGYLLDQFLRDGTNQRSDQYGGSLENRARVINEVIKAVLQEWDAGQVAIRISPENSYNDIADSNPQSTFNFITKQINQYGLAYLHVLEGDMTGKPKQIDYAQIKSRFDGPYMANSGYTKESAEQSIEQAHSDFVSFGVLYIANPDLVERFADDSVLNTPDQETFYGGDEKGYTDYPFKESTKAIA